MTNQTPPSNVESETNLSSDLQRTVVGSVPAVGSMGVSTTGTEPLNEDALDKMKVAVSEVISETTYTCSRVWEAWQYGTMTDEAFEPAWENETLLTEVVEAVLAVAQPVVNSMGNYLATPRGHYDAWTDTGDGYTQRKGWTLTCLWCGAEFTGATKGEALKGYEAHEEKILQVLRAEDAERAKNRPEVPGA